MTDIPVQKLFFVGSDEGLLVCAREHYAKLGCEIYTAQTDGTESPEDISAMSRAAFEALGAVDCFVCFTQMPAYGYITDTAMTCDALYASIWRNYLLFTKAVANTMIEHHTKGSIIYISTTHALRAYKYDALVGAFGAALHRSMKSISMQLAKHSIRVNCIAIGHNGFFNEHNPFVQSDYSQKLPIKRYTEYTDILSAVDFLSDERSAYINGVILPVDGGATLAGMPESGLGYGWERRD